MHHQARLSDNSRRDYRTLTAGAPIRHLQEMLGHASIETTQVYTRLTITDLKAAHRRFHPRERDGEPD
jgi:integrase/recombinase XerD